MGTISSGESDARNLEEEYKSSTVSINDCATYTPVDCSICGAHGTTEGVQEGTEVSAFVGSVHNKVNSLVSENLGYDNVQAEESLYRHILSFRHV